MLSGQACQKPNQVLPHPSRHRCARHQSLVLSTQFMPSRTRSQLIVHVSQQESSQQPHLSLLQRVRSKMQRRMLRFRVSRTSTMRGGGAIRPNLNKRQRQIQMQPQLWVLRMTTHGVGTMIRMRMCKTTCMHTMPMPPRNTFLRHQAPQVSWIMIPCKTGAKHPCRWLHLGLVESWRSTYHLPSQRAMHLTTRVHTCNGV